jgi:ribonuclease Z
VAGFNGATIDNFSKPVYENEDLKISAFLVEHHPIEPSLGFKIKYKDRSIVISGDTTYSQSVLEASKNTDVLFHEAMSVELLEAVNTALPFNSLAKIGIEDIQNYHTSAVDAAKLSNAGYLVLYHLLPAPRNAIMEDVFLRGVKEEFSNYILSKDGTMIVLPTNSDEILIKHVN